MGWIFVRFRPSAHISQNVVNETSISLIYYNTHDFVSKIVPMVKQMIRNFQLGFDEGGFFFVKSDLIDIDK